MKKVFFKIVVPNYNNERYVKHCLDSIFNQTFKDFCVILVDDLSTDLSFKIAKSYERLHPDQLKCMQLKKKGFAGACRNAGIDYPIESEYTWFIDSDDWIHDNDVLQKIHNIACQGKHDVIRFNLVECYDSGLQKNDKLISSVDKILFAGCGPSRNIVSSKINARFVENRSKWNDVIWLADVIDQVDDSRILIINDINIIDYNKSNPNSSTNNTNNKRNTISKVQLYSDFINKQYRKQYVTNYKVFMQQQSLNIANSNNIPLIIDTSRKKIVAMASFPARKEGMLNALNQLYRQCDKIYLWLNDYNDIPKELCKYSNVEVKLAKDYSGLKENGRLFWIKQHKDDYYLTVDDDINYPLNYVQTIVNEIEYYNQSAIVSFHGTIFTSQNIEKYFAFTKTVGKNIQVHRIGGGVAGFIPSKILLDYDSIDDFKTWDGDATISVLATKHGIKKYVIAHDEKYLSSYICKNGQNIATKNALCMNNETRKRRAVWYKLVNWEKLQN